MTTKNRRERFRAELREETLTAAREVIMESGYAGLTMRKLAERLECSPMALYSYFADKQALLTALAREGFVNLGKRLEATASRDPLVFLRKILQEYIAYAAENPTEYQILFLTVDPVIEPRKTKKDLVEVNPAFRVLFHCVSKCIEKGMIAGRDPFSVSTILWSGASGVCTVLITQPGFPFDSRKRYVEEAVNTLLAGVQHHSIREF